MLNHPSELISEVANTIDAAEKMGLQLDWIDKGIGEIIAKQEHYPLVKKLNL